MRQLIIKEKESGQRLDRYLGKYLDQAPKSFLYKMLRKKNITLNGKKADGSEKLDSGDEIKLFLSEETLGKFCRGQEMPETGFDKVPLEIVYEDQDVLLINKPVGMLSQKAEKEDVSLCEYLIDYLLEKGELTQEDLRTFRPGVCNRLDRNTSGLVAAGKTLHGLQELSRCFKDRTIHKYYLAAVKGRIEKPAHIKGFLWKREQENKSQILKTQRKGNQPIETKYVPLSRTGDATLLQVELLTGRSHQIRSHLASIGHPVLGDWKYGEKKINERIKAQYGVTSQLLHAWKLEFPQKEQGLARLAGKTFTAELPEGFQRAAREEGLL